MGDGETDADADGDDGEGEGAGAGGDDVGDGDAIATGAVAGAPEDAGDAVISPAGMAMAGKPPARGGASQAARAVSASRPAIARAVTGYSP
ncbi:hypothetical protein D3C72_1017620 [compost metagenome]